MVIGLHGKLAWQCMTKTSLWMLHTRSRYAIDKKGSSLWKTISPLVTSLALDCRWIMGNGSTIMNIFRGNLGIPCPKESIDYSIKEVLETVDLRRTFLANVNPRVIASLNDDFSSTLQDRLVWEKDSSGLVTTKNFIHSFAPHATMDKMFDCIWHP